MARAKLPQLSPEAEQWLPSLWRCGGSTRRADSCRRGSWTEGCGAEPLQRFIYAAAERSGRPQAKPEAGSGARSGVDGSARGNTLANLCRKGGWAQVRRRSRVGKALRKPLGFLLGWGVERPVAERTGSNRGRVTRSFPVKQRNDRGQEGIHQKTAECVTGL